MERLSGKGGARGESERGQATLNPDTKFAHFLGGVCGVASTGHAWPMSAYSNQGCGLFVFEAGVFGATVRPVRR